MATLSPAPSPPTVLLVAIDDTTGAEDVLRTGTRLAASIGNVELHVLRVVEPMLGAVPDSGFAAVILPTVDEQATAARAGMAESMEQAKIEFRGAVVPHLAIGGAAKEILAVAETVRADIIVVGSHGKKAVERWLLGSVSEQVVRKASCAVFVARETRYDTAKPAHEPSYDPMWSTSAGQP